MRSRTLRLKDRLCGRNMMRSSAAVVAVALILASALVPALARDGPKWAIRGKIVTASASGVSFALLTTGEGAAIAFWADEEPSVVNVVVFRSLSVGLSLCKGGKWIPYEELDFVRGRGVVTAVLREVKRRVGPPWKARVIGEIALPSVEGLIAAFARRAAVDLVARTWTVEGPTEVKNEAGEVIGLSFTLVPEGGEAKLLCRLYSRDVAERHGPVEYVVRAGELKVDIVLPPLDKEEAATALEELNEILEGAGLAASLRRTLTLELLSVEAHTVEEALLNAIRGEGRCIARRPVTLSVGERLGVEITTAEMGVKPVVLLSEEPFSGYVRLVRTALAGDTPMRVNATAKVVGGRVILRIHYPLISDAEIVHDPIIGVLKPEIGTNFEDYEAASDVVEKRVAEVVAIPLPPVSIGVAITSLAVVTALLAGMALAKLVSREEVEG